MAETPSRPTGPGTFCWMELMTRDTEKAKAFYTKLFGWTTEEMDMGPAGKYTIYKVNGERLAGMMGLTKEMQAANVPTHWLSYVHVESADAATTKARELGATIHVPPTDIPNIGRFSIVQDPTGAAIALFQPKM